MKKQQTAIEWLAEQMLHPEFHNPYIEQAKEMEKQQIEDAYKNGWDAGDFGSDCWEEIYYNEKFKTK